MLEEIRLAYLKAAANIPEWDKMNKNTLVNLYIEFEKDEEKRNYYFSAIILKYWYQINRYYQNSKNSASLEDCYEWLVHALLYALQNRKWTDPKSSIYQDPNGPDKVINRCIASTRHIFYQSSNTAKRASNYKVCSLDSQVEAFGDACTAIVSNIDMLDVSSIEVNNIIGSYVKQDIVKALILDGICFQDSIKFNKELKVFEFNKRGLVKHVKSINFVYIDYFSKKYNIDQITVDVAVNKLKQLSSVALNKIINNTIYSIKIKEPDLREKLC